MTDIELRHLPLRAIVALAVRSARRARPTFDLPGDDPDRARYMVAVDSALQLAAQFARGSDLPAGAEGTVAAARGAAGAAPANMLGTAATMAGFAATAAVMAVRGDPQLVPAQALRAADVGGAAGAAVRADYEKLLALGLGAFPELGQTIDPSDHGPLGPLWPGGPPR